MNRGSRFASVANQNNSQQELFSYLTSRQQKAMARILGQLKFAAQHDLCLRLLHFLETGEVLQDSNLVVSGLMLLLTDGMGDNALVVPRMGKTPGPNHNDE